jgi:hypothetical protein
VELLQIAKNFFKAQTDTPSWGATVDQKGLRPLAAPDLCDELFHLSPRCNPFAPGDQRDCAKQTTD